MNDGAFMGGGGKMNLYRWITYTGGGDPQKGQKVT